MVKYMWFFPAIWWLSRDSRRNSALTTPMPTFSIFVGSYLRIASVLLARAAVASGGQVAPLVAPLTSSGAAVVVVGLWRATPSPMPTPEWPIWQNSMGTQNVNLRIHGHKCIQFRCSVDRVASQFFFNRQNFILPQTLNSVSVLPPARCRQRIIL